MVHSLIAPALAPTMGRIRRPATVLATTLADNVYLSVLTRAEHANCPYKFDFLVYLCWTWPLEKNTEDVYQPQLGAVFAPSAEDAPLRRVRRPLSFFILKCSGRVWVGSKIGAS
jgi:hypothetical protein